MPAIVTDLYERTFEAIAQAVVVTDPEGLVLYWNGAAERLYGYTAAEAAGRLLRDLIIPPGGMPAAMRERERIAGGAVYAGDWVLRDKSGRTFTVHITSSAVTDHDGRLVATVGVSYDVSERRAAEARAHALAAIVEASLDAIVETDLDGVVRSANPAVREYYGYEPEELAGHSVMSLVPEDQRPQVALLMAALLAGEPAGTVTTRRLRKDGRALDTSLRLSPVRDAAGAITGISSIARDITREMETRAALEASERRFRAQFEQTSLPQVLAGLDGRITSVNDAACELIGYDRAALLGSTVDDLRHPSDGTGNAAFAGVAAGETDSAGWERLLAHRAGHPVPVHVNAALLREADGTPYAVMAFVQDLTGLRQAQTALSKREALFTALVREATDWASVLDADGTMKYVSPSATRTFGYDVEALAGKDSWGFVHPDDVAALGAAFDAVLHDPSTPRTVCFRANAADGRWVWVEQVMTNRLADPDIAGIVCNGRDVTARVEAERKLRASEARYRAIAETAQEGIWATDLMGRTQYANSKLAEILGVPLETVYAQPMDQFVMPEETALLADKLRNRSDRGGEEYDLVYPHPDGRRRVLHVSVSPLHDDTGHVGALSMISDVTDARRAEDELRRRAFNDELTGLANRALLQDRLEQSLARTVRRGEGSVAVLFADLDQFKLVNDTWGHAAGDALLAQVATRLRDAAGEGDTVARFGGDQFAVLSEDTDEAGAVVLAERMLAALTEAFDIEGERVYVSACFGIAVSPPLSSRDLMRFADAALYEAKSKGRGGVNVFDATLAHDSADRLVLSNDLRDALVNDQLTMHYQPIVDIATGRLQSVEALARWTHRKRGPVPPAQFAAIAEATGLAAALDRWAVERACREYATVRAAVGGQVRIAVNVSATHLSDPGFERMVVTAMRQNGVPVGGLSLEVTEGAIMDQPEHARALLERLRDRGITAAIDDFGTGYSSLGSLNRLPVTTLKIDRSFVECITEDLDSLAIAASIIDLARTLKLTTVAEGVETVEQLTVLDSLGCTAAQGFLWSRAVDPNGLADLMTSLPRGLFDIRRDTVTMTRIPAPRRDKVTVDHGLHELMRLHRSGASLTTIAAALNSEGYRTPRGLRWHRATVAQVISDMAYPNLWQGSGID